MQGQHGPTMRITIAREGLPLHASKAVPHLRSAAGKKGPGFVTGLRKPGQRFLTWLIRIAAKSTVGRVCAKRKHPPRSDTHSSSASMLMSCGMQVPRRRFSASARYGLLGRAFRKPPISCAKPYRRNTAPSSGSIRKCPAYSKRDSIGKVRVLREFPGHSLWEIHRLLPRANVFSGQCVGVKPPHEIIRRAHIVQIHGGIRGRRKRMDLSMNSSDVRYRPGSSS